MQVSPSLETRAYPETRRSCCIVTEHEFMASLLLRTSPVDKFHLIEPDPNPEQVPKAGAFKKGCVMGG